MPWQLNGTTLSDENGTQYTVLPHEFWYVVPARTAYSADEGKRVRPLEFAFVLHNASIAEGLLISPTSMTGGPKFRPTKGGAAGEAENLLEAIRQEEYHDKPSRFNSYFLNSTRELAEHRARDFLRGDKLIVRCLIIMNGARVHFADIDLYERLEGRPDDRELATRYWTNFIAKTEDEYRRQEILAESALYFPDWLTFPKLPLEDLRQWSKHNLPSK